MTSVPHEVCEIKPFKVCINETVTLPTLKLNNECVDVPKEVCALEKVNPHQIKRPVVTIWCNNTGNPCIRYLDMLGIKYAKYLTHGMSRSFYALIDK